MAGEIDDAADAVEQARPLDLVVADRLDLGRAQRRQEMLRQKAVAPDHQDPARARARLARRVRPARPGSVIGTSTTCPLATARPSLPCLSASAARPNTSRRQPRSAGDVRRIVGGDRLQVGGGRDQPLGDVVLLALELQQDPQQVDQRPDAARQLGRRLDHGQLGLGQLQRRAHRGDHRRSAGPIQADPPQLARCPRPSAGDWRRARAEGRRARSGCAADRAAALRARARRRAPGRSPGSADRASAP